MAVDLTPRQTVKAYGGDGGAYYEWSPAELPMLGIVSIGAAKLSLAAGAMSLPSYSDSAKVAYVLQVCYLRRTRCAIWGSKAAAHNSDLRLQMNAPRRTMPLPWKGFRVCALPSGRSKEGASSTPRSWLSLECDLKKQGIVWGHLSNRAPLFVVHVSKCQKC